MQVHHEWLYKKNRQKHSLKLSKLLVTVDYILLQVKQVSYKAYGLGKVLVAQQSRN